jgi:hypothetical protein
MDRRHFLKSATLSGSYVLLVHRGLSGGFALADDLDETTGGFFTPLQRLALADLCDYVFPDASKLGAVQYIETLLTAFDSTPPKIYAGGPYSGRGKDPNSNESATNDFQNFIPLSRYQEAAWRLKIYGDSGIPGGTPNAKLVGPQKGLRNIILQGVQQTALKLPEAGVVVKPFPVGTLWAMLDSDCKTAIQQLTVEACFSAPEYGGNLNQEGWKRIHYRGDVAPFGYSHFDEQTQSYREDEETPVSKADPGKEADPLSFTTKVIFNVVSTFTGKVFY